MRLITLLLAIVQYMCLAEPAYAEMTIGEMRCEYAINPIGIDTLQPRLAWTLLDGRRNQHQTAYQVEVATSTEDLFQNKNLLWNADKIVSDAERTNRLSWDCLAVRIALLLESSSLGQTRQCLAMELAGIVAGRIITRYGLEGQMDWLTEFEYTQVGRHGSGCGCHYPNKRNRHPLPCNG